MENSQRRSPIRRVIAAVTYITLIFFVPASLLPIFSAPLRAATHAIQGNENRPTQSGPPQESADQLVKEVVQNEIAADNSPSLKHMFTSLKKTSKGTQTHIYVETKEAMAGMLVAVNGSPLTQQQMQTEDGHLQWLEKNPDQLQKKHANEKADLERSVRIVKALPYAFNYQYDGTVQGTPALGAAGVELTKLKFSPNPAYQPPTRELQVLGGMQGFLLIDPKVKRLAEIDATLFKDVDFGWGLLGRLDKGGHFLVSQADVGDNSWEVTRMNLDITGKILLVKNLSMISDEVLSDFRRVPENLTFAEGVQLLRAEQEKIAHVAPNSAGSRTAQNQ
jgi:hypothetical protein